LAFWKEKVDKSDNLKELQRFTQKVQEGRLCKSWDTIKDLQAVIYPSLINEIRENPQQGWARGGGEDNTDLLKQLNQIRQEKETLQNQVGELQAELQKHTCTQVEGLARMDEEFEIEVTEHDYWNESSQTYKISQSWDFWFSMFAEDLITPKTQNEVYSDLNNLIHKILKNTDCFLDTTSFSTIKIQLEALKLITISQKSFLKNGAIYEYIELTPKGKQYLMQIKTVKSKKEEIAT